MRKIIHIDMDAFFASVEQRDNADLRGQPVAVGYAGPRGVVAAASYEARTFGVRSAMPSSTALRKCPQLIFAKPRFDVYKQVSQQIRAIFADYTPLIEPLSLDEAYLDVSENRLGLPSATETARQIRQRIFEATGLTASAGVSYNKFLAKLASDQNKPNGQYVIPPWRGEAFVEGLDVGRFHGVGPKTAEKMNRLGLYTGADLKRQSLTFLQTHFGKAGAWYYHIARGEDQRAVTPDRPRKSSGSETTYAQDLTTAEAVAAGAAAMADEVWAWCEKAGASGRTVTLKVKYADFAQVTRSRTLLAAVAEREALRGVVLELARGLFPLSRGVRLLGVTVSNIEAFSAVRRDPQLMLTL